MGAEAARAAGAGAGRSGAGLSLSLTRALQAVPMANSAKCEDCRPSIDLCPRRCSLDPHGYRKHGRQARSISRLTCTARIFANPAGNEPAPSSEPEMAGVVLVASLDRCCGACSLCNLGDAPARAGRGNVRPENEG